MLEKLLTSAKLKPPPRLVKTMRNEPQVARMARRPVAHTKHA